ncbi:hypothetical protein ACQKGO_16255 [Corallococcus interemptor]|uniref:hypothetical protein n=1 Tax=Corallococcus interemptor TaxID=2316720 RepID=UPI003D03565C
MKILLSGLKIFGRFRPGKGVFIVDNTPFFVRDATLGGEIEVVERDGCLWYRSIVGGV